MLPGLNRILMTKLKTFGLNTKKPQIAGAVETYSEYSLDEQRVDTIELVEHNWYNLENMKRVIKTFSCNNTTVPLTNAIYAIK